MSLCLQENHPNFFKNSGGFLFNFKVHYDCFLVTYILAPLVCLVKQTLDPFDEASKPTFCLFNGFFSLSTVGPVFGFIHQITSRIFNVIDRVCYVIDICLA